MENVGENFANSCRREDKMRRKGGRDSFEKEEEEEEHKSGDSNYCQDMPQEKKRGQSPGYFLLQEKGCKMSRDGFNGPLGRIVLLKSQDASLDRKE